MLQQFANRLTEAGLLATSLPSNAANLVFTASRIVENPEPAGNAYINNICFPIERWEYSQIEEFYELPKLPSDNNEIALSDRCDVLKNGDVFTFHNNPVVYMGSANPMFIRYDVHSLDSITELIWNYYFGDPLRLNDEWHVPVNYFPHWNSKKLVNLFDQCKTIGIKSWIHVENATDLAFRPFTSQTNKDRKLLIREDCADLYICDRGINEWLAWSKANDLNFQ